MIFRCFKSMLTGNAFSTGVLKYPPAPNDSGPPMDDDIPF